MKEERKTKKQLIAELECLRQQQIEMFQGNGEPGDEKIRDETNFSDVTFKLRERIKELNCLYGISYVVDRNGNDLEKIFTGIIDLLPPAWQYPDIACGRIIVEGQAFTTEDFKETQWGQASNIQLDNKPIGSVEVYYLEERPKSDEGPFLKEERDLIDAISERLGRVIERVWGELELKESEAKYQDLYDNAPVMFVSVDATTGKIIQCNQTLLNALGYSKQELIGSSIFEIYHPDSISHVKNLVFPKFTKTGEIQGEELQLQRKDGSSMDILLNVSAVRDEQGNILSSRSVLRDITQRKKFQQQQRTAQQKMEEAKNELGALSHSIAHDLRAPMRAINAFSAILAEEYSEILDEQGIDYLEKMKASSLKMDNLIKGLLDVSRFSRVTLHPIKVDMSELVKKVFAKLTKGIKDREINFKVVACQAKHTDEDLMEVLLTSLLSNAIKFTRQANPAVIEVGCTEEKDEIMYFVRDNGIGFDMAFSKMLFRLFERLHTEKEFEGLGIGLAVAQKIIQLHGGRIWAKGEVNQGATFFFTIPNISGE